MVILAVLALVLGVLVGTFDVQNFYWMHWYRIRIWFYIF